MGREFELKYAATPEAFAELLQQWDDFAVISMETTYYDTHAGALSARHITLRRRMENDICVCTVKTPISDLGCGEWELEWNDIQTAIPKLCKLMGSDELLSLTENGVIPVCGARFTRRAKWLPLPDCAVEIALDEGVLLGGGREMPIREVEVELKEGSEAAAVAFAEELAAQFGLTVENKSKFRRAQMLAKGE